MDTSATLVVHFTNTVTYFLPVPSTWFPLFKGGQGDFVHRPFIRHRSSEIEHLGNDNFSGEIKFVENLGAAFKPLTHRSRPTERL